MELFHATNREAADKISCSRVMNPGSHGYAGGAIYLSKREDGACRKYNNGCGNAEILIMCKVQLGRVLEVDKNTVSEKEVRLWGYDSVKINGLDVFAVYEPSRVNVCHFRLVNNDEWFNTMLELRQEPAE